MQAIEAARVDRQPWTGESARIWRKQGKCPLTPKETALLQAPSIPTSTNIYLAAGGGLMEIEVLTSVYTNVVIKSALLTGADFTSMHGNTKAALDYHVSINSDSCMATYFGNMDKMVAALHAFKGLYKTLFLSRKAFAEFILSGIGREGVDAILMEGTHAKMVLSWDGGLLCLNCFCEFKL